MRSLVTFEARDGTGFVHRGATYLDVLKHAKDNVRATRMTTTIYEVEQVTVDHRSERAVAAVRPRLNAPPLVENL